MRSIRMCCAALALLLTALLPPAAEAADGRWTHLGPFGGFVGEVVVAPTAPRTLYAATQHGVYRSDDAGGRWRLPGAGQSPWASVLAVDPSDARIVYAGRDGGVEPLTLFKTVDGGATWTPLPEVSEVVSDIAVDPRDPSRLLVAGYVHLFRSEDGGATWDRLDLQSGPLIPLFKGVAFDPVIPGVAYAASENEGFFKSVDGGATWTKTGRGLPNSLFRLAISPTGVLVAVPVVQLPARIFRSLDHGETWAPLGSIPNAVVYAFAFSPDGSTLLAGTSVGLYRKNATGPGWTRLRPDRREEVRTIAADPEVAGTFYAGLGFYGGFRGVLKSRDSGTTWKPANQGLGGLAIFSAAIAPSDPDVIYVSYEPWGLARSTNGGATWSELARGSETTIFHLAVDPRDEDVVSGAGGYGLFVRSTNGGRSWTGRQIEDGECVFPFFLSLDPRRPATLFISGSQETACQRQHEDSCHTLETADGGAHWDCLEGARSSSFSAIVADPRRASTLYGAAIDGVYKSTDGGRTWTLSSNGIPPRGVFALVIAPNGTLWAGTGAGLFRSGNGGRTWQRAGTGLPRNRPVVELVLAPSDPEVLYLENRLFHPEPEGSTYDLWVSTDRGASWRLLPKTGLPEPAYFGYAPLLVDPRNVGKIYVGTPRGLYRLDHADEP
jgi:photosystem II stability/assembly factor-like uncharacterized protein